jgi:hypothetical protein
VSPEKIFSSSLHGGVNMRETHKKMTPFSKFLFIALFVRESMSKSGDNFVNISNSLPRQDINGNILDAHDSKLFLHEGIFHWFAASYGDCQEPEGNSGCSPTTIGACGFQTNHNVTLFTSVDLVTWTNEGVVFSALGNLPEESVIFAPKTVFNPNTGMFVMWYNYIVGDFDHSFYGVATSPTAQGPFTVQVSDVSTLRYDDNGDQNLFVDADGTGYLIYTSIALGHSISIERMTSDFLGTEGESGSSGPIGDSFVEAPVMFKRNDVYFASFGSCCCYCEEGSELTVYASSSPLGPYAATSGLGELHSQSTDVFSYIDGDGEEQFMYIGDHWQSAPDGLKSHDFTVWAPLTFSVDGLMATTAGFQDSFGVTIQG